MSGFERQTTEVRGNPSTDWARMIEHGLNVIWTRGWQYNSQAR